MGEGCLKQMRDMLEGVVDAILPFCQDRVNKFLNQASTGRRLAHLVS